MTVLTLAQAAGTPGRLAPYRHTARVDAVSLYLLETSGYEARFTGLTGDSLRQLETSTGDTDAPRRHIEHLNDVINAWKGAIEAFDADVSDADFTAVSHLPWDHPRSVAYRSASTSMDTWLACRERMHLAFMDWSFDLTGTVDVPDYPLPTPVVVFAGHRVPDCDGYCTQDGVCSTPIASTPLGESGQLCVEIAAYPGHKARASVFAFNASADEVHLRTTSPAALRRKADETYQFAAALERAAHILEQLHQQEGS